MAIELDGILSDFAAVARRLGLPGWPATIEAEYLPRRSSAAASTSEQVTAVGDDEYAAATPYPLTIVPTQLLD